jgi:tripartite-type tricarboxylate transporter receptor subunit TctC
MAYSSVMRIAFVLIAIAAAGNASGAAAPDTSAYPSKPVRLIIPFSPGGTNDILARMIAQHLTERLGKTFIADNRPGADGVIGTELVHRANPDGYTLLILSSAYAMNPAVRKLPYDPKNAVEFILKMGDGPTLVSVGPALPVKSVKELFAATKARPGEIVFGTSGGFQYFATALLRTVSKTDFNIVLYKGTAPSLIDIIGGQTHACIAPIVPSLPHLRSGKLKALAAGTIKRSTMFPDLPTLDELGYKGFHASNWYTIATTPGTPKEIVSKLYKEISAFMRSPETVKTFTAMGGEVDILDTEEVRKFVADEMVKWRKVAIDSGMPRDTK